MKKFISMMLALSMVLALTACGSSSNTSPAEPDAEPAVTETAAEETPAAEGETGEAAEDASSEGAAIEVDPDGESFTFIVNLSKGEPASMQEIAWMDAITEQSLGRIQFECYYSNSLLTPAEVPNGMETGVVDIAVSSISEWFDIMPRSAYVPVMPFAGIAGDDMYDVYTQLREEFPEIDQEYTDAGMVLLTYGFGPSLNLYMVDADKDLSDPSGLQGLQILATQSMLQELISSKSGAPVTAGPTDFYSYLERSVSDGIFIHWGMITNFALCEVVGQAVIFGEDQNSGITQDMNVIVMSKAMWDSLPEDLQYVFESNLKTYWEAQLGVTQRLIDSGYEALETEGASVVHLTDDQVAAWSEAFAPVRDAKLAEVDANGCNTAEIYARMLEIAGK